MRSTNVLISSMIFQFTHLSVHARMIHRSFHESINARLLFNAIRVSHRRQIDENGPQFNERHSSHNSCSTNVTLNQRINKSVTHIARLYNRGKYLRRTIVVHLIDARININAVRRTLRNILINYRKNVYVCRTLDRREAILGYFKNRIKTFIRLYFYYVIAIHVLLLS